MLITTNVVCFVFTLTLVKKASKYMKQTIQAANIFQMHFTGSLRVNIIESLLLNVIHWPKMKTLHSF